MLIERGEPLRAVARVADREERELGMRARKTDGEIFDSPAARRQRESERCGGERRSPALPTGARGAPHARESAARRAKGNPCAGRREDAPPAPPLGYSLVSMPFRVLLLLLAVVLLPATSRAAWLPAGVDLTRPRLLLRAADVPAIQARVAREPWRSVVEAMLQRSALADGLSMDDHAIDSEMMKARSARNLAFLHAIDRTLAGGEVVPFPSPQARQAAGDRVRDLLLSMFDRSRLALDPPLGGWDRDISTSEELLQWASAYDALLGAGYDLGAARPVIEERIANLASEVYDNFVHPETASNRALDHQNNHRAKTAASLVMAAIAIAEYVPESDPLGVRDPALWLAWGLDQLDSVLRHVLVTGDGAYAEGPFYWRYASQNLIPFARAWDRLTGGAAWPAGGVLVPSFWRHPLFAHTQRWMLDMTLPDGSMAPVDDAYVGRTYYFGAVPPGLPDAAAYRWRWENAVTPYDADGAIDLGADAIVTADDALVPAPPQGSPTRFYVEGGDAIFRSSWAKDAIVAVALAEHDTASLFGRDRNGIGVVPQSHEHAEPGAFLVHAFGEHLALDPGYMSFGQRGLVNQPQHHSMILVGGRGPLDFLAASLFFWRTDLRARPPTDGQATLSDALDTGFLDAATVSVRYGLVLPGPPTEALPLIRRRFLFPDHRYLAIADRVTTRPGEGRSFTWLLHGNGGGTSGGGFERTAAGGRWSRPAARLDAGVSFDAAAPAFSTDSSYHEAPGKILQTHTVLRASVSGESVRGASLVVPARAGDAPAAIGELGLPGVAGLRLEDASGDRRVAFVHRSVSGAALVLPAASSGLRDAETDGALALFDAHGDGRLRLAWAEDATRLAYDGVAWLESASRGRLGIALGEGRAEVVAENADPEVLVRGLPFSVSAADGACALRATPQGPVVRLGRERRFVLRESGGNSAPAADPGPDLPASPGDRFALDASASCDADGDALTARWELVSAPAGSAWSLEGANTMRPVLLTDRTGPYRVRLVVTDARGAESLPSELLVVAGPACSNGIDDDRDGFFDYPEDPGCKSPEWPVEDSRCSNGIDDDGDGLTDFPADPQCTGPHSLREDIVTCGIGFELVFVLPPLLWLRARVRRARRA